ncbi:hypothetical protein, partial [Nocardia cyriacigeorgica]|uniref:hypothetical protein n=1 Tax=Nocardia cyriacigeorgica TaxID=135487 RepID=UPI0024538195
VGGGHVNARRRMRGSVMVHPTVVPSNPINAILMALSWLICSISAGEAALPQAGTPGKGLLLG